MTNYSTTSDPRTIFTKSPTLTGQSTLPYPEENDSDEQIRELTGRVETLVNETGRFRSEIAHRPIKWSTPIYDLGDPEYQLTNVLSILIEEYPHDECVIARLPELELFFEGATDIEAINGLKDEILDLFDELEDLSPDELGEDFKTWSRILHKLIEKN